MTSNSPTSSTTRKASSKVTQAHYESHSASSYESAFFYSPGEYTNYLCNLVQERLGLRYTNTSTRRRLLDIGGGTGNFTKLLLEGAPNVEAVVVDPFLEATTLNTSSDNQMIQFVKAGAESFAASDKEWWKDEDYHQALMKEVVHHLDEANRVDIFRGIYTGLAKIQSDEALPSLLIVTRPQRDIDYPLWDAAREVWAANQPSLESIGADLLDAGFDRVKHTIEAYKCDTSLEMWLNMIRSRFWSTFSNFSEEELEEACQEIAQTEADRINDEGRIHFEDRLLFISAYKNLNR